MREHRFIGNFPLGKNAFEIKDGDFMHQARRVLRLREGNTIVLSDGAGAEARGEITGIDSSVHVRIRERWENTREPARVITLFCAVLRRDNFEWVAQKATEVGVKQIVPVQTERVVKQSFKPERVQKIICEAAEQSGRGIVPELADIQPLDAALTSISGTGIFFDESGEDLSPQILRSEALSLFIGPEGGWTEQERALGRNAGMHIASLSTLTLRAETAAIVASYRAVYAL